MTTTENRASILLPKVGEYDIWPRAVKFDRIIVAATSSDGDEDLVISSSDAAILWDVRAGTFVHRVLCQIDTAFTASVTLGVGDTTDIDGWLETGAIAATSTGDGLATLSSDAVDTGNVYWAIEGGKYYQSSGAIELDVSGADPVVGRAVFFVMYSQLSS